MNTTAIIAAIIALLVGVAGGTALNKNNEPVSEVQKGVQQRERIADNTPLATDFVSMRPGVADLPSETLSTAEVDGLLFMREEEKLARDVYQTLYDQWGLQIFANIAQSEQTHTEAVRDLLVKYNITDPVTNDAIGVFVNQDMQKLYDSLVAQGATSEVEALTVGAIIEDLDINDLQNQIDLTDNADIKLVYENLLRGSRNHLRSFTKQLTIRDATYTPQYITAAEYETILSSGQETGQGGNGGNGGSQGGRGWGRR